MEEKRQKAREIEEKIAKERKDRRALMDSGSDCEMSDSPIDSDDDFEVKSEQIC